MSLKLQCPCGQKVLLEVTEQNAACPIQFICPVCGADNSAAATAVVRQMFGFAEPGPAPATAPGGAAMRFAAPPPVATEPINIRIHAPPVQAPPTAATSEPPLAPPITIAAPPPPSLA